MASEPSARFGCAPDVNYVEVAVAGELVRVEADSPFETDDPVVIAALESHDDLVLVEGKPAKKKPDAGS